MTASALRQLDHRTRLLITRRTPGRIAHNYYHAMEHAMSDTGPTRHLWAVIARHHARAIHRLRAEAAADHVATVGVTQEQTRHSAPVAAMW